MIGRGPPGNTPLSTIGTGTCPKRRYTLLIAMATNRPKPIAVCSECGFPVWNPDRIGLTCEGPFVGAPCRGVIRRAMRSGEWESCARCAPEDTDDSSTCEECKGAGWMLATSPEESAKTGRSRGELRDRLLKAYNSITSASRKA